MGNIFASWCFLRLLRRCCEETLNRSCSACRGGIAMPGHAFRTMIVVVFCLESHRGCFSHCAVLAAASRLSRGIARENQSKKGLAPASRMAPLHFYRVDAPLFYCDLCTCHRSALTMFARASDTHVAHTCSELLCTHGACTRFFVVAILFCACHHGVPEEKLSGSS